MEYSQNGNPKRCFDLVDSQGSYLKCCAMKQNSTSRLLQQFQQVVIYFGCGRGPKGSAAGMLYLMKDAVIYPVGKNMGMPSSGKVHHVVIGT